MDKQKLIEELECLEVPTDSLDYLKGADYANERAINLTKQLDEPIKVVVPKFVAEWLDKHKYSTDIIDLFLSVEYATDSDGFVAEKWDYSGKFYDWLSNSADIQFTLCDAMRYGYEVEKEPLYAVKGLTDYFRYDNKVILFNDKQEVLEIANKIGECCGIEEFNYINDLNFILISDLRNDEQTDEKEPLYYVKLPEIGYMRFGFCIPITENIEEAKKYTEQEIKAIDERYWPFAVKVEGE
ncbi:DUF1642 domain-containing protein [Enterococcus faecalis]|nr:DUF1642 domain-containing protein [Enterococcus faecalis]EGO8201139.1 DUF1642 domain-containing protein [Enterococcus faecalis]